jgi:hypothetical protein
MPYTFRQETVLRRTRSVVLRFHMPDLPFRASRDAPDRRRLVRRLLGLVSGWSREVARGTGYSRAAGNYCTLYMFAFYKGHIDIP